jgi:Secretion system C-terminal sorting domain
VKIDHIVKSTIKGIVEGRDEVLEYALKMASCNSFEPNSPDFIVSPNPASSFLTLKIRDLETTHATVDIVNVLGAQVLSLVKNTPIDTYFEKSIPLSNLAAGIYFVRLIANNEIFSHNFLKDVGKGQSFELTARYQLIINLHTRVPRCKKTYRCGYLLKKC